MTEAQLEAPFCRDIQMLAMRGGWVAPGWRDIFHAALVKLAAVAGRARGAYRLEGPFDSGGTLHVVYNGQDKVVRGILDRLERTSECTCEVCGRSGKRRDIASRPMVLCARCAAPRLLKDAIHLLLRESKYAEVTGKCFAIAYDDLPVLLCPVMQSALWPRDVMAGSNPARPDVRIEDLRKAGPMLEDVLVILDHAIEAQPVD